MNSYTHFYLYAKGWYKTENVESDLAKIMEDYTHVKKEYIRINDIRYILTDIVYAHLNSYSFKKFVLDVELIGFYNACLSILKLAEVTDLKIGRPNSNILPFNYDVTEDFVSAYDWSE